MSVTVLTQALLVLTNTELASLATKVRAVGLSAISSISALSQSTAFNNATAGEVLEAILIAQRIRRHFEEANDTEGTPSNCGPEAAPRGGGHRMRFSDAQVPRGVTWGC